MFKDFVNKIYSDQIFKKVQEWIKLCFSLPMSNKVKELGLSKIPELILIFFAMFLADSTLALAGTFAAIFVLIVISLYFVYFLFTSSS